MALSNIAIDSPIRWHSTALPDLLFMSDVQKAFNSWIDFTNIPISLEKKFFGVLVNFFQMKWFRVKAVFSARVKLNVSKAYENLRRLLSSV